jgi:hypothetical protein
MMVPMPNPTTSSPDQIKEALGPRLRRICELVGRRADDGDVTAWVTEELGKKVPTSTTHNTDSKYVVAKKQGIECLFTHRITHRSYPPVAKGRSFIPYLAQVWLREKWAEALPFGLTQAMSDDELATILGPPSGTRGVARSPYWLLPIDDARGVVLDCSRRAYALTVRSARVLADEHAAAAAVGLFIAWAAKRDLLATDTLEEHAQTVAAVRAGDEPGSTLFRELERGLWDDHLRDLPGLRDVAYRYFKRLGEHWITRDLIDAFGGREGPHGHQEPDLDDDTPEAIEKASAIFDRRFDDSVSR